MKRAILLSIVMMPALVNAMSITDAVQKTIQTHPQIEMKKEDHNTQKELLTRAKADYLPSVDLSYSVGPEVTKTIANGRESENLTRQDASATLTQNIFAGFDTVYGVQQQKALILSAGDKVKESSNELALSTATYYIEVLRTHELLQISKENVDVHKKYLSQIEEKVNAGVGRSSDYKQTLARYENALSIQYLAGQNYDNAISSFKRILPGAITAKDLEKPIIGNIPANDLTSLVEIAMKNHPTIHVSQADIQVADAALKRSNAPYYPTADIKLESYWNKNVHGVSTDLSSPNPSAFEEDSGYNALLVLNYNIFNGLADKANKQANQHRLLNKNSTLADARRYIQAYTEIAWQTFESTKQQLDHLDSTIKASAETVADYQKEHELGRRSIIDLLNIELEYNNARNRKTTAEYDRLISYYQILSYTGKILEEMNVTVE
ncbi:MAG: agglutination protein [Sulfurimonas sp. RIFCSPLOWO2_12_FULL_36_74]|uniref:TolC family outer membrane protein n=1 Tax=Sulfurimonas sp. RIFCSPLOWO2_12_36_12 TaxID=1802253 RepID=UPI0008CA21A2|nr:TolC family outer membrane protein [Sulfurimonas sp. RIFCSPLOWO2_12_36_12]OHD98591.1 MAG: agglutination protein [Sulfurimonas sp. RIFCSPLOWO2_02_FULL_36_28]OHE02610.1 MAG: agglutination protein [Sulfurimonas sp. RIFCSPLOWO2_12_36_12]OHE06337.1 MAG: agglutination protein [Sulfurimonas sp. RIFCSPLOWO2_12_FULL_36_74]